MKMVGCCTLCDREVFEITSRFTEPDPRAGQPKTVSTPLDIARRVTYQLDNASIMELTFCDACDPSDFETILRICVAATMATSKRGDPIQKYILERSILGILYERSWLDIIQQEVENAERLRSVA